MAGTPMQRWYKLIVGSIPVLGVVALLLAKYFMGIPVAYRDIAILLIIGGALMQVDFGISIVQHVFSQGGSGGGGTGPAQAQAQQPQPQTEHGNYTNPEPRAAPPDAHRAVHRSSSPDSTATESESEGEGVDTGTAAERSDTGDERADTGQHTHTDGQPTEGNNSR